MKVLVSSEGAVTVVKPEGAVVAGELDELDGQLERLCQNWTTRMVINFGDAPLIDSAGLELLCRHQSAMQKNGAQLKLCGLNDLATQIFELTRLTGRFELFADTTEAVRSFR